MISIIIPVYNEEEDITECLKSLKEQTYKNFEIITVDDGSTDKTLEIVRDFADKNKKLKIKNLRQEHRGPGSARNFAAKQAKGKILIFIDADMTFDKNYLKNLIKPLIEDKTNKIIGTTHGLEIVKNTNNIWSRCWGKIRISKEEAKNVKVFRAIRKNKFLELGGFNPKYGYADDQTLWFKYKIKPVVASGSICYHKNPETLKQVYKQSIWIGASHSYSLLEIPVINFLIILLMIALSPFFIIVLSIKKTYKNKDIIIFPFVLIFMIARYFGTISGYLRKILWGYNFR